MNEELKHNIQYLGKNPNNSQYFFFAPKNGMGRFLKYSAYPFWCKSSDIPDILDITSPVTEEVWNELDGYVSGLISIEGIPKSRGRKEQIIRSITEVEPIRVEKKNEHIHKRNGRNEGSTSCENSRDGSTLSGKEHSSLISDGAGRRESIDTWGGTSGSLETALPQSTVQPIPIKQKRHRRTKVEMEAARNVVSTNEPEL